MTESIKIGCIGQGWIGKQYADDFEKRGYEVVRYDLSEQFRENKDLIAACDIVFIAVPTPTTPEGFDASIVENVLGLVGIGKIAVIKSTLLPGTTERLQKLMPDRIIMHVPEFLREATAAKDVAEPERNIIGLADDTAAQRAAAEKVLSVLAPAPYSCVITSREAEVVKYAGNVFLAVKVVFANLLYDLSAGLEVPYEHVREALGADSRIGYSHLSPVSASGHDSEKVGRGAGGHCFIKDLEAFRLLYATLDDVKGSEVLNSIVRKNNDLLRKSDKDLDLLQGVYGPTLDIA